jgi:hypothetical protein
MNQHLSLERAPLLQDLRREISSRETELRELRDEEM